MRGADHLPPGEYEGHSPRTIWSETEGEHYNHREVDMGGGWPSDPRPMWMRLGDVVARGVLMIASAVITLALAAWMLDRML